MKFSGLNSKMAAFEFIIKLIANNVDTLYFADDEDSINIAAGSLAFVEDELMTLQNNLSKPFPYIKEVSVNSIPRDTGRESISNSGNELNITNNPAYASTANNPNDNQIESANVIEADVNNVSFSEETNGVTSPSTKQVS